LLLKDHINFMFSNVLIGPNDERFGERFTSMDNVYDVNLRKKVLDVAKKIDIKIKEAVYLGSSGPTFETHAEIRAFKILGADCVGMSTIPEVMVARHSGLKVVSLSAITNFAAGMSAEILSHEGTLTGAAKAVEKMANLIIGCIKDLGK
jgi:xanthosine phosphorylase